MAELLRPDICVLGAGAGGLSRAAAPAAFGLPAVLIEQGRMCGDCLHVGCAPANGLPAACRRAAAMRSSPALGIEADAVPIDWTSVRAPVRRTIATLAPNASAERFQGLGVRGVAGTAQ